MRLLFLRLGAVFLLSAVLLVGLAGVAAADNGDPNGAKTGVSPGQVETVYPANTPGKDSISVKLQITLFVEDDEIDKAVVAISSGAATGEVGDGLIAVSSVDSMYRIAASPQVEAT